MKGYHRPTAGEFEQLWKEGTFFLDTSVLLNLYRYPPQARSDLLRVLQQLGRRLAVPHHAALEYERNRVSVIADQSKRFRDVETIVRSAIGGLRGQLDSLQLKRRHSSINPETFLTTVQHASEAFIRQLTELEKAQAKPHEPDAVRDSIMILIKDLISEPPESQAALDRVYEEGAKRYSRRTPPGYLDTDKVSESDEFEYGGLLYRRSFGDLILWEQVISTCARSAIRSAVFVTDDDKDDWWWTIDSQGRKTLGPRPELVEEISRRAGVSVFYMYNSAQLVRWSRGYLDIRVDKVSIEQISDIRHSTRSRLARLREQRAENQAAVLKWVTSAQPDASITVSSGGVADFVACARDGRLTGYAVIETAPLAILPLRLRERLFRIHYEIDREGLQEFWIVIIGGDPAQIQRMRDLIRRRDGEALIEKVGWMSGLVKPDDGEGVAFAPTGALAPPNAMSEDEA